MKRRKFLSFSILAFLPSALLINCKKNNKNVIVNELNRLQNTLLDYYNVYQASGNDDGINKILSLIDKNFTYVADSIIGGQKKFEQSLRVIPKYLKKKQLLPLAIKERKTVVSDDVCWILCELTAHSQKHRYGILTQILKRNSSGWKIVHNHFSS